MTIAFRDASATAGNATAYTDVIPSDVQVGDEMLCCVGFTGTTVTNPTGWTQQGSDIVDAALTVRLLAKVAVSGDPGSTISLGANTTSHYSISFLGYSGVAQLGQIVTNTDGSAGTSHATTAISATAASSSWVATFFVEKSSTNTSWTVPGALTQRTNRLGAGSGAVSMCSADTNGGVTALAAQTATSGVSTKGVNIAVELQASAAAVAPGAPTSVSAVAANASATITFTPGSTGGAPVTYTAQSTPTATAPVGVSSGPIVFTGLTNGTAYTFKVTATNSAGATQSSASGSVTPAAPAQGVIAFRDSFAAQSNAANRSLLLPADMVVGDTMTMIYGWSNVATSNNPAGWTQEGADIVAGSFTVRVLTKTVVSGDIGNTVAFTASATSKYAIGGVVHSGVAGIGEITVNTDGSAGTSHLTTALTTMAASGSWAIGAWIEKSTTNSSWTAPGGLSQRVNELGTGAGANSVLVADTNGIVTTVAAQTATSGVSTTAVNIAVELLAGAAVTAPGAPTSVTAVAGDSNAAVSFTPGATGGGTVTYTAISSPGGFTSLPGASSPLTVGGLTDGTAYTFTVKATNQAGNAVSTASGSVTPTAAFTPFEGIIPLVGGPVVGPPPPPNSNILLGMACGSSPSYQDQWNAKAVVAGPAVTVYRTYSTGIPATWSARTGAQVIGPGNWVFSFTPDVASTISGGNDAALQALARTIPNGVFVCPHHEPEQIAKAITAADNGAQFARCYSLMKGANPNLLIGQIYESYTWNRRPVDGNGHNTSGVNEWMNALATAGVTPDWVGYDCYPPGPNPTTFPGRVQSTLASEIAVPSAQTDLVFSTAMPRLVCEYGMWPGPSRSPELVNAFSFLSNDTHIWPVLAYWDEDNSSVKSGINAILTTPELQVFGGL